MMINEMKTKLIDQMKSTISKLVIITRHTLAKKFDVENEESEFYKYTGLCIESCLIMDEKLRDMHKKAFKVQKENYIEFSIKEIHGELNHISKIKSEYWPLQHSLIQLDVIDKRDGSKLFSIWIDPTSEQFQQYSNYIPAMYIDTKKPWYFLPDRKNPAFNGIGKKLNEKIKITYKVNDRKVSEGIVEFYQYGIIGLIKDLLHRY